jgi:4-amino-4-deoxy-L-arabinose transferase-like glycosyltransferase
MRRRLLAVLAATALAAAVAALYATRLNDSPVYLAHDEIKFALQAHAIATTGRDINGVATPLFFVEEGFSAGRDPISIYLTALFLRVLPFSEASIRLPSALVGVVDSVLMFVLAYRIFNRLSLAVVASCLLALTPAHFMYSRFALDVHYPLPFLMLWLLGLAAYLERHRLRALFAGTVAMGLGAYTYLAFLVMMPVYALLTAYALRRERSWRPYAVAAAGLALALLPLLVWHGRHPTRVADLLGAYRLSGSDAGALPGAAGLSMAFSVASRMDVYWNFFNPSFLFLSGDSSVANSTRLVGVFLLPVAILLPCGAYQILTARKTTFNLLLLWGLLTAPLAAALLAEIATRRALVMVPFAVLVATFGLEWLLSAPRKIHRLAGVLALALVPVQFAYFYADYVGDYRLRSGSWLGGNMRGAVAALLERAPQAEAIYLNRAIPYVDAYWQFYLIARGRGDLSARTVYYDPAQLDSRAAPRGTLLLTTAGHRLDAAGEWTSLAVVNETDGTSSFFIYRKS